MRESRWGVQVEQREAGRGAAGEEGGWEVRDG